MMVWPQRLTIELGEPRPEGAEEVLTPDQRAEKEVRLPWQRVRSAAARC
jgi:hypothetical protein